MSMLGVLREARSPVDVMAGVSRKVARHVTFRPHRVALDAPIVSFSFDDFPVSAVENAAPQLEAAGFRGTWYLASGLMGRHENGQLIADAEMVKALAERGHEIGGHTHGHIDVQQTQGPALVADVTRNEDEIARLIGARKPMSFAYPFGMISVPAKLALARRYPGLRGIKLGINRGVIDLAHLTVQELYDVAQDAASIEALLDDVAQRPGWIIFYTHDVKPDPTSIGCSPHLFGTAVEAVRRRGIAVLPVIEALERIGAA
jgi:peptidoglycan/xylan/chitin deacetylase (PgdA/CDA1 family)